MSEKTHIRPDPEAATLGALAALQAAVRALVMTHPDQAALAQALRFENEATLVHLLSGPYRDTALEQFQAFAQSIDMDRPGADKR
ncbi:hypothetical protein [Paludibacterium yongneupense]|uniref:hypothetical protein n=1 Tax=Paludibacterium yongneupense TaxID=400061 RepID=UPI0004259F61|nr:hypothetical protein [Paludibacterium yongneupense]